MKKFSLVVRIISSLSILLSPLSAASDVIVSADFNIGQGIYYKVGDSCRIITPKHVLGSAKSANIMLPTREYYKAQPEHSFDIDIAILSSDIPSEKCRSKSLLRISELQKLLGVYQEGLLKTRLADGSVLQTNVLIENVGEEEFLAIKPSRNDEALKQGYSGSVLYIAEQAAGVLLEVDDQGGIVYRSDALSEKLDNYFIPKTQHESETQKTADIYNSKSASTNAQFQERLATNQIKTFPINMQANSPVEFLLKAVDTSNLKYEIAILDDRENVLFQESFWSNNKYSFAFTPLQSKQYTLRLKGLDHFGEVDIQLKDYAFDSELRGQGNQLNIPGAISTRIANKTVAEYRIKVERNSPILFKLSEKEEEFKYSISILDQNRKSLWHDEFWSTNNYDFVFTPIKSEQLTIHIEGHKYYGAIQADLEQWNTDRVLTGAQNVAEAGDIITNRLAQNAVAEYRMMMSKNAPIDFKFDKSGSEMKFLVEIIDETGKVRYREDYWSTRENRFVFTPLSSDVHIIRITGENYHGQFKLKLFDYD